MHDFQNMSIVNSCVFHTEDGFLRNEAWDFPHLGKGRLDTWRGVFRTGAEDDFLAVKHGPIKRFLGNVDADVVLVSHKIV